MSKIKLFLTRHYVFLIVIILASGVTVIPFLLANNLEGLDASGHYSNIFFIKNYFWPWPDGWNHFFFAGYPQGLFYPSLLHWLSVALSFVIPIKLAVKVLISLAMLGFVSAFYYLSLKELKSYLAAALTIIVASFTYFLDLGISGNVWSDLFFGLLSHLFSLTLFILYLLSLRRLLKREIKFIIPSLLLALIIFSHVITGIAAVLLTLIAACLASRQKKLIKQFTLLLLSSSLLTISWWLPLVINIQYLSGSSLLPTKSILSQLIFPFILLVSILSLVKAKRANNLFIRVIGIFNLGIILLYLAGLLFPLDNFPFHFYRFIIYAFLLSPLSLGYLIKDYQLPWRKLNLVAVLFLFYFFSFLRIIPVGPHSTSLLNQIDDHYLGGRVISTGVSQNLDLREHATRMKLVEDYQMPVIGGLLAESANNGQFFMSLLHSWGETGENFVWGYAPISSLDNLAWGAKVLGVNYEYQVSDKHPVVQELSLLKDQELFELKQEAKIGQAETQFDQEKRTFKINRQLLASDAQEIDMLGGVAAGLYYQSFYQVADSHLAETLNYLPLSVSKNWSQAIERWWGTDWLKTETEIYDKPILAWQLDSADWQPAERAEDLEVDLFSEEGKMASFSVQASQFSQPVPIYVKVSYFPFWKAYLENGQEIPIYKASPNFMLVYAQGEITFRYEKPRYYYLAYSMSGLTLLTLLSYGLIRASKKRRLAEKNKVS